MENYKNKSEYDFKYAERDAKRFDHELKKMRFVLAMTFLGFLILSIMFGVLNDISKNLAGAIGFGLIALLGVWGIYAEWGQYSKALSRIKDKFVNFLHSLLP